MLLKQFLNEKELINLKSWNNYSRQDTRIGGKNCSFWCFDNSDQFINNLRNKFLNIVGINSKLDPLLNNLITEIKPIGFADIHTDGSVMNHKHIRCNILINKADEGGFILHGNNKIIMNEGDAYILDTSIKHGISTVKGNNIYKLISFGFSVPI